MNIIFFNEDTAETIFAGELPAIPCTGDTFLFQGEAVAYPNDEWQVVSCTLIVNVIPETTGIVQLDKQREPVYRVGIASERPGVEHPQHKVNGEWGILSDGFLN